MTGLSTSSPSPSSLSPSSLGPSAGAFARLTALVLDNPIADKDGQSALNRAPLAVSLALPVLGTLFFLTTVLRGDLDQLARWGDGIPSGRELLGVLFICTLLLQAIVLPTMAAASLANERERNTWQTLVTTSLTPGAIVIGKMVAASATLAVQLMVMAPLFALCSWAGAVGAEDLLVLLGTATLHGLAQLSVGIYAGANARSSRNGVVGAVLVATVLVTLPLMFPALSFWFALQESAPAAPLFGPLMSLLGLGALLVTATALVSARSTIAPRAAPRRAGRSLLLWGALVVVPVTAVLALGAWPGALSGARYAVQGYGYGFAVLFGILAGFAVVFEVSTCAGGPGQPLDAPSGRRSMLRVLVPLAVGLVLVSVIAGAVVDGVTLNPNASTRELLASSDVIPGLLLAAVPSFVFFAGVAGTTALVSRVLGRPAWRAGVTLAIGAVVLLGPLFLTTVAMSPREVPLLWLNPLAMATSMSHFLDSVGELNGLHGPFDMSPALAGMIVWGAVAVLGAFFGPKAPAPRR